MPESKPYSTPDGTTLPEYLRSVERGLIEDAMAVAGGVKAEAARRLGIHRTTLVEKLKSFGMHHLVKEPYRC